MGMSAVQLPPSVRERKREGRVVGTDGESAGTHRSGAFISQHRHSQPTSLLENAAPVENYEGETHEQQDHGLRFVDSSAMKREYLRRPCSRRHPSARYC